MSKPIGKTISQRSLFQQTFQWTSPLTHTLFFIALAFSVMALIFTASAARSAPDDDDTHTDQHQTAGPKVPVVTDLTTLAPDSAQRHVPILIMFSAADCDYCMRLEEDVIRPMMISGEFDRRAIVRKVMLDDPGQLKDFSGTRLAIDNYATQHKVRVTPTLMFVDANGKELAPKVIGYQTAEFYAAYLDNAIDVSTDSLLKQQSN